MNERAIDGGVGIDGGAGVDDTAHYGGTASDPKELKPGDRVAGGAYEIEAVLGKGGMTTVYLANATAAAAAAVKVALKIARGKNAARADVAARMRNEAQIGVQLEPHRNLVRTLAGGLLEDGSPFVATEFVRAPALADVLIMDRTLPVVRAVRMAIDIGRALLAMHAKGFVHRDVKPGNILMLPECAVLLDLGLATKAREPGETSPRMTAVFERPGTKHYMAPEQAAGAPADVRADVWSLAATLAEALVGEPPMGSLSEAECVAWKLDGSAPQYAMPRTRSDVPEGLAMLVESALVREPRLRSSIGDFVEGLTRVLGVLDGPGAVAPTAGSGSTADGGRSRASMLMEIHRREVTQELDARAGSGASDGRGGTKRRLAVFGVVATIGVIGLGVWAWSRGPATDRGSASDAGAESPYASDEVVPAAAVLDLEAPEDEAADGPEVAAPRPVADGEAPAGPTAPVDERVAKPTPPIVEVAKPSVEAPKPTPAVKPKAPTPKPTPAPAGPPEHETAECKATRDAAADARARGDHATLLAKLARKGCWDDKRAYKRDLVRALAASRAFDRCVSAGRGSSDPIVVSLVAQCEDLRKANQP